MDNDAVEKAIRNATDRAVNYSQYQEHQPSYSTDWHRMYLEMREEMWRYRRQCWELRDRLYELQRRIREAIESSRNTSPQV